MDLTQETVFALGTVITEAYMALAYSAADIFVHPAIEDNLPNTVLESLMCATPVVAFEVGGLPDMVVDGRNGLLCPEVTAIALAATIERALNKDWDSDWIRKDAVKRFDAPVQARRYLALYEKIVGKEISQMQTVGPSRPEEPERPLLTEIVQNELALFRKQYINQTRRLSGQVAEQYLELKSKEQQIQQQNDQLITRAEVIQKLEQHRLNTEKQINWYKAELDRHRSIGFLLRKIGNLLWGKMKGER